MEENLKTVCVCCGKPIEADSAYCNYCGKRQAIAKNMNETKGKGRKVLLVIAVIGGIMWYAVNQVESGTGRPPKATATQIAAKVTAVPATVRPSMPMPPNGDVTKYTYKRHEAPFEVVTPLGYEYYYIVLSESTNSRLKVISVLIHPGSRIEIEVPLGKYKMFYATGEKWYGRTALFGEETKYYQADDILRFYADGDSIMGHTIELIKQVGGNLETMGINEDDFPI